MLVLEVVVLSGPSKRLMSDSIHSGSDKLSDQSSLVILQQLEYRHF